MNESAKEIKEKTVRYLGISDAIGRLSGSVGKLESFLRTAQGNKELGKDGEEPITTSFYDIYSTAEGRLNEIKTRITDATAMLRELIEG